jgi:hypothetical protein
MQSFMGFKMNLNQLAKKIYYVGIVYSGNE